MPPPQFISILFLLLFHSFSHFCITFYIAMHLGPRLVQVLCRSTEYRICSTYAESTNRSTNSVELNGKNDEPNYPSKNPRP